MKGNNKGRFIITFDIWWIPIMKRKLVPCVIVMQKRNNWMANKTIPDSIMTNMIGRSLLPPDILKFSSSNEGLTSRYALTILRVISPVTIAFTVNERAMLIRLIIYFHRTWTLNRWALWDAPVSLGNLDFGSIAASQVANKSSMKSK